MTVVVRWFGESHDHVYRGVYVTLAPFPVVPRDEVGFRVQLTAANTAEQVDHLLTVLAELTTASASAAPIP